MSRPSFPGGGNRKLPSESVVHACSGWHSSKRQIAQGAPRSRRTVAPATGLPFGSLTYPIRQSSLAPTADSATS